MSDWLMWCQAVLLVSTRLAVGLASTPVFGVFGMPMLARLIMTMAFAVLVVGVGNKPAVVLGFEGMLSALAFEAFAGLVMAVAIQCAFTAFAVAGRMLDVQMGFSVGSILDPVSKGHSAVMTGGFNTLAVIVFFGSDAHAVVLAAACQSFQQVPLLAFATLSQRGLDFMLTAGGAMFATGLALASPVVVSMLLTDVVVAVVSRNMPQMNLLFVSIPLKILLGLTVLVVSMRAIGSIVVDALSAPGDWLTLMMQ
jgi:flagellar biosynthetic protein FliR